MNGSLRKGIMRRGVSIKADLTCGVRSKLVLHGLRGVYSQHFSVQLGPYRRKRRLAFSVEEATAEGRGGGTGVGGSFNAAARCVWKYV